MSPELDLVRRRRRGRPLRWAVLALGVLVVLGVVALSAPVPFGAPLRLSSVPGDQVAITWRSDGYRPGTEIVYDAPGAVGPVTGRVVEATPRGYVTARTDWSDPGLHGWRPDDGDVRGRVLLLVPRAVWLGGGPALVVVVLLVVLVRRRPPDHHRGGPAT